MDLEHVDRSYILVLLFLKIFMIGELYIQNLKHFSRVYISK